MYVFHKKYLTYRSVQIFKMLFQVPRILCSRIWSSAQDCAVLVLFLNIVEWLISTRSIWSGGNVLYQTYTSPERANRRGWPLNIFSWFIGSGGRLAEGSSFDDNTFWFGLVNCLTNDGRGYYCHYHYYDNTNIKYYSCYRFRWLIETETHNLESHDVIRPLSVSVWISKIVCFDLN